LLNGYEEYREKFGALGVNIVAGTVDSEEKVLDVSQSLGFPVAFGMTRADGDLMGSWWEENRDFLQPTEFILRGSTVIASTYSNSPVGRMDPAETLSVIEHIDSKA